MTSAPTGTIELMNVLTKSLKSNTIQPSLNLKTGTKTPASYDKQMLNRMMGIMRKNHVDPQLMNMLRYETYRIDQDRTMLLPSKTFKDIYRNLNIKMPLEDFNFFIEYMKLNARNFKDEYDESQYIAKIMAGTPVMSKQFKLDEDGDFQPNRTSFYKREKVQLNDCSSRMTLNLRNLCKIVDACAKMYWADRKSVV